MQRMLAANLENLLFLLLLAVAVLFQILAKAVGKASKDQTKRASPPVPGTPPPIPRAATETGEEKIRKLLEALGHPPTSKPPAPVAPRTDIPPRTLAPVQPPTVYPPSPWQLTREERRKRKAARKEGPPPPPPVRRVEEIVPPKITVAPPFEVREEPLPVEEPAITKTPVAAYAATRSPAKAGDLKPDIATLLESKSDLRNAIILREILGAPRGLQAIGGML
jgi:hypothetical protein